jgi:hypothetical protein
MSTMNNGQHCFSTPFTHEVDRGKPLIFRKPALRNVLCIGIATISFTGITQICGLFPGWITPLARFLSFIVTLIVVFKAFSIYERRVSQSLHAHALLKKSEDDLQNYHRDLGRALLFLLYMDEQLWDKVYAGDTVFTDYPYDSHCTKDIPLGLILQHLRQLTDAREIARRELARSLENLGEDRELYDTLHKLDSLILQHIPEEIRAKHQKAVYSIRFNLLRFVFEASERDEHFYFNYNSDTDRYYTENYAGKSQRMTKYRGEDTTVIDFFIMVLNEFYADDWRYDEQCHEFDPDIFRNYFLSDKKTGTLVKNDLQQSISRYEKEIRELEDHIADLRVQIHDLQVVLDVFFAEYNAKVGVLYVDLDRIKLKIKEYRKRLELAAGRDMTEEEARKIDEEIERLYSDAREKINDLEDEATEASEDYDTFMEEEENRDSYGPDFLDELKQLFRKLVLKFHPDMAEDEEQKSEFHTIFIRIREAYEKREMQVLQEYLEKAAIESGETDETPEEKRERLEKEFERLKAIHEKLKIQLERMQKSELNLLRERVEEAREDGEDLLQELAEAAEKEIERKQAELDELMKQYDELIAQAV